MRKYEAGIEKIMFKINNDFREQSTVLVISLIQNYDYLWYKKNEQLNKSKLAFVRLDILLPRFVSTSIFYFRNLLLPLYL